MACKNSSQSTTTFFEMDNLNKKEKPVSDMKKRKSRSQSVEILSTFQVSNLKVDSPLFVEAKRPRTSDSTIAHVLELSSSRQVLKALEVCEASLSHRIDIDDSVAEVYSTDNDDFKRVKSLLEELKKTLLELSARST